MTIGWQISLFHESTMIQWNGLILLLISSGLHRNSASVCELTGLNEISFLQLTWTTAYTDKPWLTWVSEAGWHAGAVCTDLYKQLFRDFGIFECSWKNFPWNRYQNSLLYFELPDYLARELLKRGFENSWKRASTCLLQAIEQLVRTEQE